MDFKTGKIWIAFLTSLCLVHTKMIERYLHVQCSILSLVYFRYILIKKSLGTIVLRQLNTFLEPANIYQECLDIFFVTLYPSFRHYRYTDFPQATPFLMSQNKLICTEVNK